MAVPRRVHGHLPLARAVRRRVARHHAPPHRLRSGVAVAVPAAPRQRGRHGPAARLVRPRDALPARARVRGEHLRSGRCGRGSCLHGQGVVRLVRGGRRRRAGGTPLRAPRRAIQGALCRAAGAGAGHHEGVARVRDAGGARCQWRRHALRPVRRGPGHPGRASGGRQAVTDAATHAHDAGGPGAPTRARAVAAGVLRRDHQRDRYGRPARRPVRRARVGPARLR